ncbi:hypothetical protein ACQE3E_15725 [Methylomonas sp. MED-D]|uniref:hypothetical protein n=1 Tax=unclassified Methylomonas TaxID=2608980 RepID=UPI003D06615E
MANLMLGYGNLIESSDTLSGGSWSTSFPLANVKNRRLAKVARTVDDATGSSWLNIDLGANRTAQCFAAIRTNLSAAGVFRVRAAGNGDSTYSVPLYDSGYVSAAAFTPDLILGLAASISARYWRLEIADSSNPDGYIEIGRIFVGPALAPADNMSYGNHIGYRSRSEVVQTQGGAMIGLRRVGQRQFQFALDWMNEAEAIAALELQRVVDITDEVLLIRDRTDTTYNQQRHFLGQLSELSPIDNPYVLTHQVGFNVVEVIA